jgi:hypothetical protein
VQTLAKAAVAQALDKAILKDSIRGSAEDATDIDTWKALVVSLVPLRAASSTIGKPTA